MPISSMCSSGWKCAPNQPSKKAWAASRSGTASARRSTRRTKDMASSLAKMCAHFGESVEEAEVVLMKTDRHAEGVGESEGRQRPHDDAAVQQGIDQGSALGDLGHEEEVGLARDGRPTGGGPPVAEIAALGPGTRPAAGRG